MPRLDRKNEHIYFSIYKAPARADFSDVHFVHNCLPDRNFNDISLKTAYLGRTYRSPLFINALTGGTKLALRINASLAAVSRECGLPMAVGSQMAALEEKNAEASFRVVRRINPVGTIWANIGSYADPGMVHKAVQMIRADGAQIHLNAPQELIMSEGEPRFSGMIERIRQITGAVKVPVIIKEVGFGIAGEQAHALIEAGAAAIDIGGRGGTNFLAIESRRSGKKIPADLKKWGIPTAISLAEVVDAAGNRVDVFASGGMHEAVDIAKSLALGACAAGMAGYPVYLLLRKGRKALVSKIKAIEKDLRLVMMMVGASSINDLRETPLVITGFTAEWMLRRGLDPSVYARRAKI